MQQANQVVSHIRFSAANQHASQQHQQRNTAGVGEQTKDFITKVFEFIKGAKPAWKYTFTDNEIDYKDKQKIKEERIFAENRAMAEWTKAFVDNNITQVEQIKAGLRKMRNDPSPHFPSCGQFIKWCTPELEDYGLPEPELAYREACSYSHNPAIAKWTHQAVYEAAKATGWFELKTLEEREALPLFKRNYKIITRLVIAGEPISDIPKALPGEVLKTPAERNQAYHDARQKEQIKQAGLGQLNNGHDALAKMRAMIGGRHG